MPERFRGGQATVRRAEHALEQGIARLVEIGKEILDLILDRTAGDGLAVLPGSHEYGIRANWKALMENTMDGYHLFAMHRRFMDSYMKKVMNVEATRAVATEQKVPLLDLNARSVEQMNQLGPVAARAFDPTTKLPAIAFYDATVDRLQAQAQAMLAQATERLAAISALVDDKLAARIRALPTGAAIEQMLADYQVMRDQARACARLR